MPVETKKINVASLVWNWPFQLHRIQGEEVIRLGYDHQFFVHGEPIPPDTQILLIQGPYGGLWSTIHQLINHRNKCRPVLVYWFQQSILMYQPEFLRLFFGRIFSELHHRWFIEKVFHRPIQSIANSKVIRKGASIGFIGDILWLQKHGLLDVLALSSTVYSEYFNRLGIPSVLIPRGYHSDYGELLNLERDIALVWMGKLRTPLRREKIYWLREQLQKEGLVVHVYDGVENDFIFGERRTEILNRARFVLNVYFSGPTDEVSLRYFVAGANGAVVITEPGKNKYPFVPGEHLVECEIEKMPQTIMDYLEHKDDWQRISNNMSNLIRNELTLTNSLEIILRRAEAILEQREKNNLPIRRG